MTVHSSLTWRWCFYINLPIGGFTILACLFFLHLESPLRDKLSPFAQLKRLDPVGMLFFAPSMVCLILALQWGGTAYAWSTPRVIGLLVAFAITFVIFIVVEILTPETAMAPTRVVLNRSVAGSMLFMLLLAGSMQNLVYYLSIWFQAAQGQTAIESGIRTIPLVVSLVVFGIVTGIFTQKVGYYVPPLLLSPIFIAIGAGLLSTLTPNASSAVWIGYQILFGLGCGCGMQTSNLVPQNVLSGPDVPIGMALQFFMKEIGGAVFIAVGQNIFTSRLVGSLSGIVNLDTSVIINTGATALRTVVPPSELEAVAHAYSYALTRVFILATALGACMILGALAVEWKSIKTKKDVTAQADVERQAHENGSETDIEVERGTKSYGEIREKRTSSSTASSNL